MSKTKAEVLNELYVENGLTSDDIYQDKRGFTIITRTGIEKIQGNMRINIDYEPIHVASDFVVLKVIANLPNQPAIQTFGEASTQNINNRYIVSMAEKRGLSRAVLKLSGFYKHGVYGEDEYYEEKKVDKEKERLLEFIRNIKDIAQLDDFRLTPAFNKYDKDAEVVTALTTKESEL